MNAQPIGNPDGSGAFFRERNRDVGRRTAGPANWIASSGLVLGLLLLTAQQMALEVSGEPLLTRAWTHPGWAAQLLLLTLVLSEGLRLGQVVRGNRRG
ncbi:MAG: hypothetical protein ACYS26_04915 [Planctomycetota bacterium]|jgi:hypothetical protein